MTRRELLTSLLGAAAGVALDGTSSASLAASPFRLRRPRSIEPWDIDIDEELIADLHRRLDQVRWPEIPFATGWTTGTNDQVLRDLVSYWRHEYDWYAVQDRMNQLQNLRGPIDGEQLHCVRYPTSGSGGNPPILLIHGWPSSFWEFHRAAPNLVAGAAESPGFEVVVPSLPGFAFSQPPRQPGTSPAVMAERLHALMRELGYDRYGVQGGDWGAIIGTQLARRFPQAVVGLHVSFVASAPPPPNGTSPSQDEQEYRDRRARFRAEETGYSAIQSTRPQSLGYAQQDSPAGWLAWMLEKFWAWSDHGGDLWNVYSRDDLLTTAMLYWLPNRVLSAARIYYESANQVRSDDLPAFVQVPTGYARFPREPWSPPREVVARTYNLVHYSEHPRGGHFPALEQPELWSRDVAAFFTSLLDSR